MRDIVKKIMEECLRHSSKEHRGPGDIIRTLGETALQGGVIFQQVSLCFVQRLVPWFINFISTDKGRRKCSVYYMQFTAVYLPTCHGNPLSEFFCGSRIQ